MPSKVRVTVAVSMMPETKQRLLDLAAQKHKSVSQTVVDLIWAEPVRGWDEYGRISEGGNQNE